MHRLSLQVVSLDEGIWQPGASALLFEEEGGNPMVSLQGLLHVAPMARDPTPPHLAPTLLCETTPGPTLAATGIRASSMFPQSSGLTQLWAPVTCLPIHLAPCTWGSICLLGIPGPVAQSGGIVTCFSGSESHAPL